jgi:ABC-type polysaccharide/polyol phosphate transport system ATPase subunit
VSISLDVHNVGLVYPLRTKFSLAPKDRRMTGLDMRVDGRGRRHFVSALEDVSFSLNSGDRLGLVGNNGAGKTTLLKVLYGIYPPTRGTIEARGRIDALFNINLGFRREATGRRNIELRGLINGWKQNEIDARMEEIITFSELEDFIDMPIKAYSQGMAARLAFSTATSLEPEILLMDEWIGAGDPPFQEKARQRMRELADRAGIVVLASHNHKLLRKTCNKILMLEKGRVRHFFSDIEAFDAFEKEQT